MDSIGEVSTVEFSKIRMFASHQMKFHIFLVHSH